MFCCKKSHMQYKFLTSSKKGLNSANKYKWGFGSFYKENMVRICTKEVTKPD